MLPASLTLQERVRLFNLGTPTPMHVGTHELVNELWRELEKHNAAVDQLISQRSEAIGRGNAHWTRICHLENSIKWAIEAIERNSTSAPVLESLKAAIAAAVGDRPACAAEAASARRRPAAAQPQNQRDPSGQEEGIL